MIFMLTFSEDTIRTQEFIIILAEHRNHTIVLQASYWVIRSY